MTGQRGPVRMTGRGMRAGLCFHGQSLTESERAPENRAIGCPAAVPEPPFHAIEWLMLKHLPNAITVLRMVLVIPIAAGLWRQQYEAAFWVFAVAGASDGVDGFLARRFGWQTRFGAVADPLADKLMIAVTVVALGASGALPVWLVVLVVARDLVIFSGALAYHLLVGPYEMSPSVLGKSSTLLQITLVLVALVHAAFPIDVPLLAWRILIGLVAAVTLASGMDYVLTWSRKYRQRGLND